MHDEVLPASPQDSGPPAVSDKASDERDQESARRDRTSEGRDRTAADRDRTSDGRDRKAEKRDRAAEDRDRLARRLEAASSALPQGEIERRERAGGRRSTDGSARSDRASAASDRAGAASDREAASAGRQIGARDRTDASDDRDAASSDRDASARDRAATSIDELTGAYRRGGGLVELEREMIRAIRMRESFIVAFVDVDSLKSINDSLGHEAGDRLLRRVVDSLQAHLRSYDLVIRFGGDEFVCGLSNLSLPEATQRFERINGDLSTHHSSITIGLAELEAGDSLDELIAKADKALYEKRHR